MRRSRSLVALLGLFGLFALTSAPAGANHAWENYHWARSANPVRLEVVDSLVGEWDTYLPLAVADWNQSSVLDLTTSAGGTSVVDRTACLPISGKIHVCNAVYPDPTWLGLATVYLNGDHIVQATAQVNDLWFDSDLFNDPNAKRHVLCQEVGHDFGLDHQYTQPTCMDDINGLFDPAYISPASHDYAQLDSIYAHLDGTGGGGSSSGNNGNGGGRGGPKPKSGSSSETGGDCSEGSCGSIVRVWQDGEFTVVQYVLLAPTS
ncbi:MAG: hypothetical protein ACRDI3_01260 [Actinomycetota bacterium]